MPLQLIYVSGKTRMIALPHEVHVDVNSEQRNIAPRTQTPIDNVNSNIAILANDNRIPQNSVDKISDMALQHVRNSMYKGD